MSNPVQECRTDTWFENLFEHNPRPMLIYCPVSLGFRAVNDAAVSFYGYSHAEFQAMLVTDIRPADEVERCLKVVQSLLASESKVPANAGTWRHLKKNGDIAYVDVVRQPVRFDGRLCFCATVSDITAYVRGHHALENKAQANAPYVDTSIALDLGLSIQSWNHIAARRYGYSAEQALARPYVELLKTEFNEPLQTILPRLFLEGDWEGEALQTRCDGQRLTIQVHWKLECFADGTPWRILETSEDVTRQRYAEKILHDTEEQFRIIFEMAPVGIARVAADGRFVRVNSKYLEITGYSEEELTQLHFQDVTHSESAQSDREDIEALYAGRIPCFSKEKRYTRKNGEVIWVHVTGALGRPYANSRPDYHITIAQDVTARKTTERLLHESQARLSVALSNVQEIMDKSRDVICTFDCEGRFVQISAAAERLWGYRPEELIGRHFLELVCTQDISTTLAISKAIAQGQPCDNFQNRYVHRQGHLVYMMWSTYWSPSHQTYYAVGRDVTDRHRSEEAIAESTRLLRLSEVAYREQSALLQSILDSITDGVVVTDRDGQFLQTNPAAQRIINLDGPLHSIAEWHAAYDIHLTEEHTPVALEALPLSKAIHGIETDRTELSARHPRTGQVIHLQVTAGPLRNTEGDIEGGVVVWRDITAEKLALEALRQAESRFRLIVESTRDYAIFMLDPEGRVNSWNPGAERILGYSEAEVMQQPVSMFYTRQDIDSHRMDRNLRHAQLTGRWEEEGWRVRKDGQKIWVRGTVEKVLDKNGNSQGFVKIIRDNTDRKRAEDALRKAHNELEARVQERTRELRQANNDLKELSAHLQRATEAERTRIAREIHDDLGGHLTAIKFELSTWDSETQAPATGRQRAMAMLDETIAALRRIINDLRPSILDNLGLWAAIEWQVQTFSESLQIACSIENRGDRPAMPAEQSTAIFRIVQEALTNIARHAKATRVIIRIARTAAHVRISIADNGKGFLYKSLVPASSFGLLSMRERAHSIRATLRIRSAPNEGTRLVLRVPTDMGAAM